jgi:hypothetical protein
MTDSYSYSYDYTGSYTGDENDYSYSYSYSDTATEEKANGHAQSSPSRPEKASASAAAAPPKGDASGGNGGSDGSYSYSYSYSDPSSPLQTHPPHKGKGAAVAAVAASPNPATAVTGNQKNISAKKGDAKAAVSARNSGSTGDDYSYSYSYSDDYDDNDSYSYSYSYTESDPEPKRRNRSTPTPAEAAAGKRHGAAVRDNDTGSYSYSYSYSYPEDSTQRSKRPVGQGGTSDGYYYYSDGYGSSSYYYTDEGSYYDSDSYSYTGDSSYYYYSTSSSGGAGNSKAKRIGGVATDSSSSYYYSDSYYTGDYYYSDSYGYGDDSYYYSGSTYYYTDDSYYYSDSYEDSDYYYSSSSAPGSSSSYYYYEDGSSYGYSYSYTDSAASKSETSTTSSYGYTSSSPSLVSVSGDTEQVRDMVVLRAPAQDTPHVPPAPRRCFVAPKSAEDSVWSFLQRLMRLQETYEARRAAATAAAPPSFVQRTVLTPATDNAAAAVPAEGVAAAALHPEEEAAKDTKSKQSKSKKEKKAKKKKPAAAGAEAATNTQDADEETQVTGTFIPTKSGCFSERSLRIAFQVLRLNHLERTEALKNAPVPLPMETMFDIFNTCVAARAKERVAQAFLAHDTYRSGEIALSVMGGLLRRLGLGTSPVMEGFRISLAVSSDTVPEIVMNVEQLVRTPAEASAAAAAADEGKEVTDAPPPVPPSTPTPPAKTPVQWEVTPVYVSRIVRKNAAAKKPTPVLWEHNTIYMGRHAIVRNVTSEAVFERLKTYIEAATYLCVLSSIFTIHDADRGSLTVQYPQFVRSVLLAVPPPTRHGHHSSGSSVGAATMKLLVIENLFRTVFHPAEVLSSFEAGRGFPRYLHNWAVESTLHATNDTEEKRRRNVVPSITADNVHFVPTPPMRPPAEVQLSFLLQKVRVPGRPPANARCFCLVSAITTANVFLPAVEVPVRDIVKSSKDPSGYTWVFYDKAHHKKDTTLCFAGPAADRIYVECCYETRDSLQTTGEEGVEETGPALMPDSAVVTVWCAGYAVFAVDSAKTTALPVLMGSLLQGEQTGPASAHPQDSAVSGDAANAAASSPSAAGDKVVAEAAASSKCFGGCFSRLGKCKRKVAPMTAANIKIEVVKDKRKPIEGVEKMPTRFIAYQRHVPMIAQLRTAVEMVGKETAYALQTFRHQAVRYIFSVAADAALLDQLCMLWAHHTKHWSKAERKDEKQQHVQLLSCVAALYALNNCCASNLHEFAQSLKKKKPLHMAVDESAPLLPVRV